MGVPYKEQSPKTKETDVIMNLSSLAYITPIRLSLCMSTGRGREREIFCKKIKIGQKRFYSQVNDKE